MERTSGGLIVLLLIAALLLSPPNNGSVNEFATVSPQAVFLIKNLNNDILDKATTRILVEKMSKEWERIGMEQMYKDMKNIIREEIEKQGNKSI